MAAVLESKPGAVSPGGAFLFQPVGAERINTPESFSEEQRLYFKTAMQFAREQILPNAEKIEHKDNALLRNLIAKSGELGLLMIDIPEAFGGLGLDKTTSMLVGEANSLMGSWSVTMMAHTGIGTLPIVWFGNAEQKAKYLPKLATGEWVAAYALTEQGSGSDALGAKTKAVLSPDGKHYVLNGSKLYITNAAFADVFVVFAKVDGDKFTGFIVEKDTPGFSVGPEEKKMGIRGSSTCPLYFEDAKVPVENVLGEIGKGHKIAFNILNLGRLKLGAGVLGGMKLQTENALKFAQERKQFQAPIASFPLIREKLAKMAMWTYAIETMTYRTSGLVDARLANEDKTAADFEARTIAAIEEHAIEASIIKVYGSEFYNQLVDEAVQLHGGAGFIEDYPVERAYRDNRINRIFEGTNEINRMLAVGMILKRAMKGGLPLLEAAQAVEAELESKQAPNARVQDALANEERAAESIKKAALYAIKVALEAWGPEVEKHQVVLAAISDLLMDAFTLDSIIARTRQAGSELDPVRVALVRMFATDAMARAGERVRKALCGSSKGEALQKNLERVATLNFFTPYDPAELRETIVKAMEKNGGYPFAA